MLHTSFLNNGVLATANILSYATTIGKNSGIISPCTITTAIDSANNYLDLTISSFSGIVNNLIITYANTSSEVSKFTLPTATPTSNSYKTLVVHTDSSKYVESKLMLVDGIVPQSVCDTNYNLAVAYIICSNNGTLVVNCYPIQKKYDNKYLCTIGINEFTSTTITKLDSGLYSVPNGTYSCRKLIPILDNDEINSFDLVGDSLDSGIALSVKSSTTICGAINIYNESSTFANNKFSTGFFTRDLVGSTYAITGVPTISKGYAILDFNLVNSNSTSASIAYIGVSNNQVTFSY